MGVWASGEKPGGWDGMARMGRSARKGVCLLRVPVCWILGLSGGDRLPQV